MHFAGGHIFYAETGTALLGDFPFAGMNRGAGSSPSER